MEILEAIEPIPTDFGTNFPKFNNGNVEDDMGGIMYTFFTQDDIVYELTIGSRTGIFGFGTFRSKLSSIKSASDFHRLDSEDTEFESKNGLRVFNKVFYIILKIIPKIHVKTYIFNGASEKLHKLYTVMSKNANLNSKLNSLGFSGLVKKDKTFSITKLF